MTQRVHSFGRAFTRVTLALALASASGCGSSGSSQFHAGQTGSGTLGSGSSTGTLGGGNSGSLGGLSGGSSGASGSAAAGDPRCAAGGDTTISGTVYDPAVLNPLYKVTVYIPSSPLPTLPKGASCAACADYYPSTVVASAITDEAGHFTLRKASPGPVIPEGANVPLVVQTGKWRMQYTVAHVSTCTDNPQPDHSLHLPADSSQGDLPDIAISTGGADSLECLPLRMGVKASEYVSGFSGTGHIHIFVGGDVSMQNGGADTRQGAPVSSTSLWNSTANLTKNDVVLLSCEGSETFNMVAANQQSLWDYAGAGGRVFSSHFHYAWFTNQLQNPNGRFGSVPGTGPFSTANLATWATPGSHTIDDSQSFNGNVVTTLNVGGGSFPQGVSLNKWLGNVGALTNGQLPIFSSRHNADVGPLNTPSQPWIILDNHAPVPRQDRNATQYFSFDTPIGAAGSEKCGRVVYSDLHVSGGPMGLLPAGIRQDYSQASMTVPEGCANHALTPQEKALEYMLFDLSSCLVSVNAPATTPVSPPPR